MTKKTKNEIKNLIYRGYIDRYLSEKLFSTKTKIPMAVIEFFLETKEKQYVGEEIYEAFKIKYILSENELEGVRTNLEEVTSVVKYNNKHAKEEVIGLSKVYDYISSYSFENILNFNIYNLLTIHEILFSETKYFECGGKFRNYNAMIAGSNIETSDYLIIPQEISKLYEEFYDILKYNHDVEEYIDKIIKLHARLIQIHPFFDGNGRSTRALFNLQLRYIGVPPIYIKYQEKEAYCNALQIAITEKNFKKLNQFFLFKIANTIIEHDANFAFEALNVL